MRVSIVKSDPGYRWNAKNFKVKFNGEFVQNVITADEEKRHIVRYVLEANGLPKIAPDGEHLLIETVEGDVEVVAENAGVNLRLPKVKVERNTSGVIEVLVYSAIKPGVIRRMTLDEKTLNTRNYTVEAAVSILAGAAAEHLAERNGELFDPADCARLAQEEYKKLLKLETTQH